MNRSDLSEMFDIFQVLGGIFDFEKNDIYR